MKTLVRLSRAAIFLKLLTILCKVSYLGRNRVNIEFSNVFLMIWFILIRKNFISVVRRSFRIWIQVTKIFLVLISRTIDRTISGTILSWRLSFNFTWILFIAVLWVIWSRELLLGFLDFLVNTAIVCYSGIRSLAEGLVWSRVKVL